MAKPLVELKVDGDRHAGWTSIRISGGLDQVADRFELSLTERWAADSAPRPITAGAACVVLIDKEPVITGYIDDVLPAYDDKQHSISVSGRSKTADLVDCSQRRHTWSQPRTLEQIARELAEPFGIEVIVEADTGKPLRSPAVEAGQPLFEALAQMARYRGVILIADAQGNLVITKPPRKRIQTALVLGENILVGAGRFSVRDRFSEVIVQGQQPGDEFIYGTTASSPEGVARDADIRYRPQVIIADTGIDKAGCQQRAKAETRRGRAKGRGVTYTVNGWRHQAGLWRKGDLVPVRDHWLGINDQRLIESFQFVLDESGVRTELRVVPPAAWDLTAEPEPAEASAWG